jgi:hypothetical protein
MFGSFAQFLFVLYVTFAQFLWLDCPHFLPGRRKGRRRRLRILLLKVPDFTAVREKFSTKKIAREARDFMCAARTLTNRPHQCFIETDTYCLCACVTNTCNILVRCVCDQYYHRCSYFLVTEGSLGRQVWRSESSSWFLQTQCEE